MPGCYGAAGAEGIWIVSYTRETRREGEKEISVSHRREKSPKNGSVRDLTLWFRIKEGGDR